MLSHKDLFAGWQLVSLKTEPEMFLVSKSGHPIRQSLVDCLPHVQWFGEYDRNEFLSLWRGLLSADEHRRHFVDFVQVFHVDDKPIRKHTMTCLWPWARPNIMSAIVHSESPTVTLYKPSVRLMHPMQCFWPKRLLHPRPMSSSTVGVFSAYQ